MWIDFSWLKYVFAALLAVGVLLFFDLTTFIFTLVVFGIVALIVHCLGNDDEPSQP